MRRNIKLTVLFFPNNIIILKDYTDNFLKVRMKQMPEEERKDTHYNDEGFTRKMAIFKILTNQQLLLMFKISLRNIRARI